MHINNAPSYSSTSILNYLRTDQITFWKTHAQNPDVNPIKLVWNDMKSYVYTEVKPNNKQEIDKWALSLLE